MIEFDETAQAAKKNNPYKKQLAEILYTKNGSMVNVEAAKALLEMIQADNALRKFATGVSASEVDDGPHPGHA